MYTREETIEEERLDWVENPRSSLKKRMKEPGKRNLSLPPVLKHKKISSKGNTPSAKKIDVKRRAANILDKNEEFSLSLSILFLPYILGFIISYMLFYFYGGMPIESFITIEKGNMHFQLWSIGAYLFITAGVIWAVLTLW